MAASPADLLQRPPGRHGAQVMIVIMMMIVIMIGHLQDHPGRGQTQEAQVTAASAGRDRAVIRPQKPQVSSVLNIIITCIKDSMSEGVK